MTAMLPAVDLDLHDCCEALVHRHGPQTLDWLTRRARRDHRDARIDEQAVISPDPVAARR